MQKRGTWPRDTWFERFTTFILQAFLWEAGIIFFLIFVVPVIFLR